MLNENTKVGLFVLILIVVNIFCISAISKNPDLFENRDKLIIKECFDLNPQLANRCAEFGYPHENDWRAMKCFNDCIEKEGGSD